MRVRNHRLFNSDGSASTFIKADKQGGELRQSYIIMHYTAGGSAMSTVNYFASGSAQASAHVVIERDGTVYQQVKFDTVAWHAGLSAWKTITGLNRHSIGIELANWGKLREGASGYRSHTGVRVPDDSVVFGEHRNFPGQTHPWEVFPEAQMDAAQAVVAALVEAYAIPQGAILGHDDIAPSRKIDPGPGFEMELFRARIFGRSEDGDEPAQVFVVRSASGLNLRKGPGVEFEALMLLPDGAEVHVIERRGTWWLVAAMLDGREDLTGFVHSHWLRGS